MKKFATVLAGLFLFVCAFASEQERFSIPVGGMRLIDFPFSIENYRISSKGKISVEEVSPKQLRIIGQSIGECSLSISGGNTERSYNISIVSNISSIMKRLRNDLESVPELDLSINGDYIVIRGTVSSPENWKTLQKVLSLYDKSVNNFAVFRPAAETILGMKRALQNAGFVFCAEGKQPAVGELSMQMNDNSIIITGELHSQTQIARIKQIMSTYSWLAFDGKASAEKGQVNAILNLTVVETPLQVEVVYVGITEEDLTNLGGGSVSGNANLGILYDIVAGKATSKTASFGGDMNATLNFLQKNGVSRIYKAGHVSFTNSTKGTLHTGGTIHAKVSGGDNGDVKNINYGLQISVTGTLISENMVRMELQLSNSHLSPASGGDYNQTTDSTNQTIICELDRTMVLAGAKSITEKTSLSGLPILRNTPVLQWFVATDDSTKSETRLLILVCPRKVQFNPDVQITIPVSDETAPTYRDAKRPNAVRKEENKRYRGSLNWLNWFSW